MWINKPNLFTFPNQMNRNHAKELSIIDHVISEWHWKSTFDFNEIVNNDGLKRGTVCQIVRLISHFSLKLYIQYWKYFHSIVLGSVGRDYSKKKRGVKIFGQVGSASLSQIPFFYHTERVRIVFAAYFFLPKLSKITVTCPNSVKTNK